MDASGERVTVTLVRGAERRDGEASWQWRFLPRRACELSLVVDGRTLRASGPDLFEALVAIRRQVEPDGWLIAVQGSRIDTYPSGMARDMGGGEQIYQLRLGEPATFADLVDTLGPALGAELATVEAQQEFWERWRG